MCRERDAIAKVLHAESRETTAVSCLPTLGRISSFAKTFRVVKTHENANCQPPELLLYCTVRNRCAMLTRFSLAICARA